MRTSTSGRPPRRGSRPTPPRRRIPWFPIVIALIIIVPLGAVILLNRPTADNTAATAIPTITALRPTAGAAIEGVMTFTNLSRDHVEGQVNYPQTPPVGGPHNPAWLNCGIYDRPAPNENAVHSLEHGAVWITYQPDLPAAEVEKLRGLVRGHSHALLSPYPGLPARVVASAWGVQLRLPGVDDPRLPQFIGTYEQGPQTPEPGAPCSGGRGVPIVG